MRGHLVLIKVQKQMHAHTHIVKIHQNNYVSPSSSSVEMFKMKAKRYKENEWCAFSD